MIHADTHDAQLTGGQMQPCLQALPAFLTCQYVTTLKAGNGPKGTRLVQSISTTLGIVITTNCNNIGTLSSSSCPQNLIAFLCRRQDCRDAGNQCCYDKNGYLITDPPGAGTVDRISPERSVIGHFFADVLPSFLCSGDQESRDIYLDKRPIDRRGLILGFRILRFLGRALSNWLFL